MSNRVGDETKTGDEVMDSDSDSANEGGSEGASVEGARLHGQDGRNTGTAEHDAGGADQPKIVIVIHDRSRHRHRGRVGGDNGRIGGGGHGGNRRAGDRSIRADFGE